ncbi:MAG: FAD-dependent oxidoreductase [Deltaproteobacteria bacterium]|nr:FAD-dependent oxidoreductase [Deltaproteobacteria bacterium]
MKDILFSSWQGQIIDNRGKELKDFAPVNRVTLPEYFKPGEKIKAMMGWGGIIIHSEGVNILDLCRAYIEAVSDHTNACDKCNYCKTGFTEMLEVFRDLTKGEAREDDPEFLQTVANTIIGYSKCSIGKHGPVPIVHALKYFKEDFSRAISGKGKLEVGAYYSKLTAPCMDACPIHLDIPKYIERIKEAKFADSLDVIREDLPLPGVVGRVCYHPCEDHCQRANVDEPIAIRLLKRFVVDQELSSPKKPPNPIISSKTTDKVAIIGAGPAGLTCAYHLARKGFAVTIFEKQPVAGGMMSVGIPEYRLPEDIVQSEIEAIKKLGVEIKTNMSIGKDMTTEHLRKEGYEYIFISIGAQECKKLGIEGEELEGVYSGLDFLKKVRLGEKFVLGKRIAVIGGGNVAIDAVRTTRRLGAEDAFIIYRRSLEEMPAHPEEIQDCEAEGINILTLTSPKRLIGENGKIKAIECLKMTLGEPDASGRPRPIPVEGSEFFLEVDGVIPALGQESDWACLGPECVCTLSEWGTIKVNSFTLQTDDPTLLAGGDAVLGPQSLIEASAMGKKAAFTIDSLLNGSSLEVLNDDFFDQLFKTLKVYDPKETIKVSELRDRIHLTKLPPEKRTSSFDEVEQGFSVQGAVAEAERCLRCYRVVTVAV